MARRSFLEESEKKPITIGENIASGVYVAEVIQGTFRKSIRIVKVNE